MQHQRQLILEAGLSDEDTTVDTETVKPYLEIWAGAK